jgi:hypothetical protein
MPQKAMKQIARSFLAEPLIGMLLLSPCAGQEQKFTQAEINAAFVKHRAERYAYLERSQQEASKVIQMVIGAWPNDHPGKRRIATTAAFNDTGKWCHSPWSMASIDPRADPPLLVVCPIALDTYTELVVAMSLATAHYLPGGYTRVPTAQEGARATRAGETSTNAILSYYAKRLVGLYTSNVLSIRTPQHCLPEDVAYQAVHSRPLDECAKTPKGLALKWLTEKKIDQDKLDTLSSGMNEAIYLAVVAHEVGHVATIGTEVVTAMDEEIQADRFAQRILSGDPKTFYLAGEMLEQLNILWVVFSQLDIKTRYHLPPHEEARATAFARRWRCVKRTDVKDQNMAKMLEELRLLKIGEMPPNFCEQRSK